MSYQGYNFLSSSTSSINTQHDAAAPSIQVPPGNSMCPPLTLPEFMSGVPIEAARNAAIAAYNAAIQALSFLYPSLHHVQQSPLAPLAPPVEALPLAQRDTRPLSLPQFPSVVAEELANADNSLSEDDFMPDNSLRSLNSSPFSSSLGSPFASKGQHEFTSAKPIVSNGDFDFPQFPIASSVLSSSSSFSSSSSSSASSRPESRSSTSSDSPRGTKRKNDEVEIRDDELDVGSPKSVSSKSQAGPASIRAGSSSSVRGRHEVAIIADAIFQKHLAGKQDYECAGRALRIERALQSTGLLNNVVKPRRATYSELNLCHSPEFVKSVETQASELSDGTSAKLNPLFKSENNDVQGDVVISKESFEVASYAVGAPLTAIDDICAEKYKRAFCIVRPPGHHAHRSIGSGFCVFNNAAIAANYAIKEKNMKKVLIVDWDAHHGDGTQRLIQDNPNIFYFSTHVDTQKGFYPGSAWGKPLAPGQAGYEHILNCPIKQGPNAREDVLKAFRGLKNELKARGFSPDLVVISCGFDAHRMESGREGSIGTSLGLESTDFGELTRYCVDIANEHAKGRIVSVLEGGYEGDSIGSAAVEHVRALNDGNQTANLAEVVSQLKRAKRSGARELLSLLH